MAGRTSTQFPSALRFIGSWQVAAPSGSDLEEIEIQHSSTSNPQLSFKLLRKGKSPIDLTYVDATDTLVSKNEEMKISFWSNPSSDMISAVDQAPGNPALWTARKTEKQGGLSQVMSRVNNQDWLVIRSSGNSPKAPNNLVSLRAMGFGHEGHQRQEPKGPGLFGLFLVKDGEADQLYDLVHYNETHASFFSVLGTRTLKYWPGKKSSEDRLFATLDNSFSVPLECIGVAVSMRVGSASWSSSFGKLLPFEEAPPPSGGQPADPQTGSPSDIQDPDAGCWCAEPPPR